MCVCVCQDSDSSQAQNARFKNLLSYHPGGYTGNGFTIERGEPIYHGNIVAILAHACMIGDPTRNAVFQYITNLPCCNSAHTML